MTEVQDGRSVPAGKTLQSTKDGRARGNRSNWESHFPSGPSWSQSVADSPLPFRFGSKASIWRSADRFRSTPINGHRQTGPTGPLRVKGRHCSATWNEWSHQL